ncbi:MAG: mechanosensitive ion channel family protein [Vicinamibacterales bacterium]
MLPAHLPAHVVAWLERSGIRIVAIVVLAWLLARSASLAARRFERSVSHAGPGAEERTRRVQTLARIARKTVGILVTATALLMILRETGIDITPVLTGAGVAGLAVGFGAQTLVRDVISGFFLLLEDQVRVGDVVIVNGQGGLVEELNLRTIVLRDVEGTVHVFPNGEVRTLANRSKDFSFYVLDVPIRSDEDADRVIAMLQGVSASLVAESPLGAHVLEPLEVFGVDSFGGGNMVVRVRLKTLAQQQWAVGRELRKRVARALADAGIEMPGTRMDVHVEGLDGTLRALNARGERPA